MMFQFNILTRTRLHDNMLDRPLNESFAFCCSISVFYCWRYCRKCVSAGQCFQGHAARPNSFGGSAQTKLNFEPPERIIRFYRRLNAKSFCLIFVKILIFVFGCYQSYHMSRFWWDCPGFWRRRFLVPPMVQHVLLFRRYLNVLI